MSKQVMIMCDVHDDACSWDGHDTTCEQCKAVVWISQSSINSLAANGHTEAQAEILCVACAMKELKAQGLDKTEFIKFTDEQVKELQRAAKQGMN